MNTKLNNEGNAQKKKRLVWKPLALVTSALFLASLIYIGIISYIQDKYNKYGFPYGTFSNGFETVEYRKDGTADYKNSYEHWVVPVKYGINGNLYTEMAHNYPSTPKIPATYYWEYDGKNLTFKLWGVDENEHRKYVMTRLPYRKIK